MAFAAIEHKVSTWETPDCYNTNEAMSSPLYRIFNDKFSAFAPNVLKVLIDTFHQGTVFHGTRGIKWGADSWLLNVYGR